MKSYPGAVLFASVAVAIVAPAASAQQYSESYTFLKAVRDADGNKVTEILGQPGQTIINTRDPSSGEAALHIVTRRGDGTYMRFLLSKGANPNIRDGGGNTPAMIAVEKSFNSGLDILARYNANFDVANDRGETPLIRAVQMRNLEMVRNLLKEGADPDKADVIAGMSARDYAKRDTRSPAIAEAIAKEAKPKKRETIGPQL